MLSPGDAGRGSSTDTGRDSSTDSSRNISGSSNRDTNRDTSRDTSKDRMTGGRDRGRVKTIMTLMTLMIPTGYVEQCGYRGFTEGI